VRATSANGCSSSQWPTMRSGDGAMNSLREGVTEHKGRLEDFVSMWSTPRASDGEKGGPNQSFATGTRPALTAQAQQWPTPQAHDATTPKTAAQISAARERSKPRKAGGAPGFSNLNEVVEQWPTPMAVNYRSIYASEATLRKTNHARPLQEFVGQWVTPSASDDRRGGTLTEAMTGTSLAQQVNSLWSTPQASAQADQWMTPRVERGAYTRDNGDPNSPRLTLEGQASLHSFLPDRPISTVGEEHSHIRRSLNPLFVEWLMGWPPAWTLLALTPPASNGCACSATALSRYRQRMRSALYALGSAPEALPAQLGLFA
jgi:hypothetical protein